MEPWVDQLIREHRLCRPSPRSWRRPGPSGWAPAIALGVTLPALLLPNGQLRSRRWRLVVASSVTGAVLVIVAGSSSSGPVEELGIDNPLGLAGTAGDVAAVLTVVGVVLHWLSLPPAAVCVVLRFRSSRGSSASRCAGVAAGAAPVGGLLVSLPSGRDRAQLDLAHRVTRPCCRSRWVSPWRCCATGCGTWTASSPAPSPTPL